MTTVLDTITRGVRMLGARPLGDALGAEEADAGLTAFQSMVLTLFPATHLTDVLISANYEAGENERITDTGSHTVTYPTTVTDADTGDDRAPLNGALVQVNGTTPTLKCYVAELAGWQALNGLALTDEQPLGPTHDEGLAAMLAVRVAPDLQVLNVPPWVAEMATAGRRAVRQRFRQPYTATTDPLLLSKFQRNGTTL